MCDAFDCLYWLEPWIMEKEMMHFWMLTQLHISLSFWHKPCQNYIRLIRKWLQKKKKSLEQKISPDSAVHFDPILCAGTWFFSVEIPAGIWAPNLIVWMGDVNIEVNLADRVNLDCNYEMQNGVTPSRLLEMIWCLLERKIDVFFLFSFPLLFHEKVDRLSKMICFWETRLLLYEILLSVAGIFIVGHSGTAVSSVFNWPISCFAIKCT